MRNNDLDRRDSGMSNAMKAGIAALVLGALLFMWAPWGGPRVADSIPPGTTVGSSTTRPSAPASPVVPAPTTPSTTR